MNTLFQRVLVTHVREATTTRWRFRQGMTVSDVLWAASCVGLVALCFLVWVHFMLPEVMP